MKATIPGYGDVWFHPRAKTNIFSLKRVSDRSKRVLYDTSQSRHFIVSREGRDDLIFVESKDGLYYINGNPSKKNACFMNTLRENKSMFSKRQWQRAVEARATHHKVGAPSIKDCKSLVRHGLLKNMPVTIDDIYIENKFSALIYHCYKASPQERNQLQSSTMK